MIDAVKSKLLSINLHGKHAWQSYEEVTEFLAGHPFEHLRYDSIHFCRIEKFTVILYDKTSESPKFGERDLFCQKNHAMDRIPSTKNALLKHIQHTIFSRLEYGQQALKQN